MDIVNPIVTPVVESLLVPVKRHLGFLFSSTDKVKDMHAKLAELDGAKHDMCNKQESSKVNRRAVPHRVPDWLEEVKEIEGRAEKVPKGRVGCFNLKMRYKAGKDSSYIFKDINRLLDEKNGMVWPDEVMPLGALSPPRPSTSGTIHEAHQNKSGIESRDLIFNDVLKSLDPNNIKTQKMALCGMGGIGKTTMMEQLRKAAKDRGMFSLVVNVAVGQKLDLVALQQTVVEYIGGALTETTRDTRAECLKKIFEVRSEEGKKKILVILDDVWEAFNLKDIGLASPLPSGFKLLITSREESVCTQMGVSLIFKIDVLKDLEAKQLFWDTIGVASVTDIEPDLCKIGEDIVKRCGGLPIAINTIASTLRDISEKNEWKDALFRIHNQEFPVLINIFEFSYNNLKEDDLKATFILSGLFPEDHNIAIENLVMYSWGLKIFKNVHNIAIARSRVSTHVNKLIRSNLLIRSDREGCVKMHDLVRDFVLSNFSKVKRASILNHNSNVAEQFKEEEEESYKRILLKCEGMTEFPVDFDHTNLSLLKLMEGDKPLKFPKDFYTRMDKLEVVACENIHQPLLLQYSTNLRALCLCSCSLVDNDISFLGDLINLEVLSLVNCGIKKLPSKIGNLKRLKLLGLSESHNLHVDDGVFENLEGLEELYLGFAYGCTILFTDANCKEFKELSWQLSALELQFFENKVQPINVSFKSLERFRISMGCQLEGNKDEYLFKNTLMLVISKSELLECKINELFSKTEILHLEVNDMHYLEDILMHPLQNSFCGLNALHISGCASLTYLFTIPVAKGLAKLETIKISSCPMLQSVVNSENNEAATIMFHKLKVVSLKELESFVSLCDPVNVMKLPQLTELRLFELPNITSIFPKNI